MGEENQISPVTSVNGQSGDVAVEQFSPQGLGMSNGRTVNTVYENTTGRPFLLIATLRCFSGESMGGTLELDGTNFSGYYVGGADGLEYRVLVAIVAAGGQYEITDVRGDAEVLYWSERVLTA